jgi:hypothetical protein
VFLILRISQNFQSKVEKDHTPTSWLLGWRFSPPLTPTPAVKREVRVSSERPLVRFGLIQPIFLFELSGKVAQVLKVLVGARDVIRLFKVPCSRFSAPVKAGKVL